MSRYVDIEGDWVDDAIKAYSLGYYEDDEYAIPIERFDSAPSIDMVRCAECVYCNVQNTKYLYAICERHGIEFKPFEDDTRTHGCAWGERKESE